MPRSLKNKTKGLYCNLILFFVQIHFMKFVSNREKVMFYFFGFPLKWNK